MDEAKRREQRRRSSETILIGGRPYRERDNGEACVLMPVYDPAFEARRADNARAITKARATGSLAGVMDTVAILAGASPQRREQAFALGTAADTVMEGVAPPGARGTSRPTPRPPAIVAPPFQRPPIRYKPANAAGQAVGVESTVTFDLLGTGKRANRKADVGGLAFLKELQGDEPNYARAHLQGRALGGSGDAANLMALLQNPTNSSQMRKFENGVIRKVRRGEVVEYSVRPFYDGPGLPPRAIFLMESGSRGGSSATIIDHPPGRMK